MYLFVKAVENEDCSSDIFEVSWIDFLLFKKSFFKHSIHPMTHKNKFDMSDLKTHFANGEKKLDKIYIQYTFSEKKILKFCSKKIKHREF